MKYTIHRLLALKKSTGNRIDELIDNGIFLKTVQGLNDNINGVPLDRVEADIRSNMEKFNDLISNYKKIKMGLLNSNAGAPDQNTLKKVMVCGQEYTMAELIFMSDEIYGSTKNKMAFMPRFLAHLNNTYLNALNAIEKQKRRIDEKIDMYVAQISSSKEQKQDLADIQARSEMFHRDGDLKLVDPLDIKKVIDDIKKEIDDFITEADAVISENNALTVVELDLTERA